MFKQTHTIKIRHAEPLETASFTLAQARLAELDLRDRLDPFEVEIMWVAPPEELEAFLSELGETSW